MIKKYQYKNFDIEIFDNQKQHLFILKKIKKFIDSKKKYELKLFLQNLNENYAIILNSKKISFGITDQIASLPVFFDNKKKIFTFKNLKITNYKNINKLAFESIIRAGYSINNQTLLKHVYQLSPGTIMNSLGNITKYFEYLPNKQINYNYKQFDKCLNDIFINYKNVLNKDSIIYLSLSAGKDSRLIAAKLKEHNFSNVICYTYGTKYSNDYKISKLIANKLNFKHYFIEINNKKSFDIFKSKLRNKYWNIYYNINCIPNMQDFYALYILKEKKILKGNNNFFINGQTADFLTGAHLMNYKSTNLLIKKFYIKNFSILNQSKINSNIFKILHDYYIQISREFKSKKNFNQKYIFLNKWEYEERQSKFILQQQRCYEFFNQNWLLPFWEKKFINFWRNINFIDLKNQKFYKGYLLNYDLNYCFSKIPIEYNVNQFGNLNLVIRILANILKFFVGKKIAYNLFLIFSINNYHFFSLGNFFYIKNILYIRNINSIYLQKWIKKIKSNS